MSELCYLTNYNEAPLKVAMAKTPSLDQGHRELALRVHKMALEKMEAELKGGPTPMTALPYAQMAQATGVRLHLYA